MLTPHIPLAVPTGMRCSFFAQKVEALKAKVERKERLSEFKHTIDAQVVEKSTIAERKAAEVVLHTHPRTRKHHTHDPVSCPSLLCLASGLAYCV